VLDPGDDLDPSLVSRLEPCGLHLGILVWAGADEVVAPAVLVDLARVPLDDDLATSISVSARRSTADRTSTQCVAADDVIPFFMLLGIVPAVVSAAFLGRSDDAARMSRAAVQFEHRQQISAAPHGRALHRLPSSF
jgi:hypothetical protein